jgi:hypothetical protein
MATCHALHTVPSVLVCLHSTHRPSLACSCLRSSACHAATSVAASADSGPRSAAAFPAMSSNRRSTPVLTYRNHHCSTPGSPFSGRRLG